MKVMIFGEFASTGALEISVFHKLLDGKGTKPLRLAPWPTLIPLQVWGRARMENISAATTPMILRVLITTLICPLRKRPLHIRVAFTSAPKDVARERNYTVL